MQLFKNKLGKFDLLIFLLLIVFTVIGVAITDASPAKAHAYWLFMNVVFAMAAILTGWRFAEDKTQKARLLVSQLFHWGSTLVAVFVVYSFLDSNQINSETVSLMILLVLAFSVFLDGVHVGWHFSVLGVLLAITAVVISYIDEYVWIIILVAIFLVLLTLLFNQLKAKFQKVQG